MAELPTSMKYVGYGLQICKPRPQDQMFTEAEWWALEREGFRPPLMMLDAARAWEMTNNSLPDSTTDAIVGASNSR